jgi:hypothetical protein
MKNNELFNENNEATYCPEDDKLRLYIGRVPHEEYKALRAEGWQATAKQECDFAAVWTSRREDTALSYAGIVLDEDQSPADRAADRAERFSGYLDKRRSEAHEQADKYDAGPQVHGYQDKAKAVRAADRHDRLADRACDAWSKAEYWQRRTAGVISNALYKSSPSVRMGRIKRLESDQRKHVKSWTEHIEKLQTQFDIWQGIAGKREKILMPAGWRYAVSYHGIEGQGEDGKLTIEQMRLIACLSSVESYSQTEKDLKAGTVTPREVAEKWLSENQERPSDWDPKTSRFWQHCELRLAYERQMLEAAGGRAGEVEMVPGGFVLGYQIHKVNKSRQTGRVTTVQVMAPAGTYFFKDGRASRGNGSEELGLCSVRTERLAPDSYRAPTPEELEEFTARSKAAKAKERKTTPKLINPTLEEAQRLQARLNADCANSRYNAPCEVIEYTQAKYSNISKGSDWLGVKEFEIDGHKFKVRCSWSWQGASSIVCIVDKPQKKLPAFAVKAESETEKVEA